MMHFGDPSYKLNLYLANVCSAVECGLWWTKYCLSNAHTVDCSADLWCRQGQGKFKITERSLTLFPPLYVFRTRTHHILLSTINSVGRDRSCQTLTVWKFDWNLIEMVFQFSCFWLLVKQTDMLSQENAYNSPISIHLGGPELAETVFCWLIIAL